MIPHAGRRHGSVREEGEGLVLGLVCTVASALAWRSVAVVLWLASGPVDGPTPPGPPPWPAWAARYGRSSLVLLDHYTGYPTPATNAPGLGDARQVVPAS